MKQILPGILRLQVVDCSLLPPNVSLKSKANLPISVLADTTEISFVGSPKCEYNIKNPVSAAACPMVSCMASRPPCTYWFLYA